MGISKRLAIVVSGAAFTGFAALALGAAAPASAAVAAPATGTHLVNHLFGCGCWDECDGGFDDFDWDW